MQHDKISQYVFVYGTLKRGYGNHVILRNSQFIGEGHTIPDSFSLIDGGFPWAIPNSGTFHIKGELYLVEDQRTMHNLDSLEGVPHLFDRYNIEIRTEDGSDFDAIMYVAAPDNRESLLKGRKTIAPRKEENVVEWGR